MDIPERGEIWLTEFDPAVGTEIKKTRPALVISNNIANSSGSKVTVVPLTSRIKKLPIVVIVQPDRENNLQGTSLIRVPDICTFDKIRLKKKLGKLNQGYMDEVDVRLKIHLAL
ncbi:MAG TPA: type II toxin-antitoxin system PemK/MazF family toxin [Candidatus Eremiobacteraeota bacterium]|nr:MAG: mRNA interferase MazF9 [bacterium ADurb.Bin363]HPZ07190.1 type II toxin-antitoxin system PemK/MazF family toxin [Candidatus Eremiobacteraeota bacterium]